MNRIQAKKKFGQNFLTNSGIQSKFADCVKKIASKSTSFTSIIEIGPGMGAITQHLVKLSLPTTVYEIDPEAVEYLQSKSWSHLVTIIEKDILTELSTLPTQYIFVSNLPFNIGSRILIELTLQEYLPPIVVVLQKEVIEKLLKKDDFTLFGAWLSLFWKITKVSDISPGSFNPPPKVTSTLIEGLPLESSKKIKNKKLQLDLLKKLVRFPSKTLKNNLSGILEKEKIERLYKTLDLNLNSRLGWDNYIMILNEVFALVYENTAESE